MWIVARVKIKELNIFKIKLIEKLGREIKFYHPKIEYSKYFKDRVKRIECPILENYIFCYHPKFNESNFLSSISFIKGLQYIFERT